MSQMTIEQLVRETVDYYQSHPRAKLELVGCHYYIKENQSTCAVGRCLNEPELVEEQINVYGSTGISSLLQHMESGDIALNKPLFKSQYQHFDESVWESLQQFHDNDYNWDYPEQDGFPVLSPMGANYLFREFGVELE